MHESHIHPYKVFLLFAPLFPPLPAFIEWCVVTFSFFALILFLKKKKYKKKKKYPVVFLLVCICGKYFCVTKKKKNDLFLCVAFFIFSLPLAPQLSPLAQHPLESHQRKVPTCLPAVFIVV